MSELRLNTDGHIIKLGADNDVTLTHVADTGLLLNSTMQLQFNDSSQFINAPSATVLDINATDEIELNATLVDINANVEISGTATTTGVHTFSAAPVFPDGSIAVADLDIDGATDIGAALVDADLLIVDDGAGGTNRKTAMSRIKTYVEDAAGEVPIANLNIDGGTDIGAALVDADEIIVDDGGGGTNRRCDMSRVKTYIGDHTPTFLAYQNGAVNINSASATLINLQTEAHDSDGKFASSRFTPTVAGTYFVSGACTFFDSDMDVAIAMIYFNGAEKVKSAFGSSGGIKPVEISRHVSATFVMDADDYVELYGYAESSNDGTIAIGHNSTAYQSYLTAFRLA